MSGPDVPAGETPPPASGPLVRREVVLLVVLSVVAVGLFLLTRRMAEWERQRVEREAAIWFAEGQTMLEQGRNDEAADVLRRSVLADRSNEAYSLALARALADSGRDAEARTQLTRLRELAPDNAEVNYRLAQLLARADEPEAATRHYYLALYSPDSDALEGERRRVGIELATYLLDREDQQRAADVLTSVAREDTEDASHRVELAALFERAGRLPEALDQYAMAAGLDDTSIEAASGAGTVALRLGDYGRAEEFLRLSVRLGYTADRDQLDLVLAVRRLDPMASGLSSRVRATRLADGLAWADRALAACGGDPDDNVADALAAVRTFRRENTAADLRDADVLVAGTAVVVQAAERIGLSCDGDAGAVRAWRVIGDGGVRQ